MCKRYLLCGFINIKLRSAIFIGLYQIEYFDSIRYLRSGVLQ